MTRTRLAFVVVALMTTTPVRAQSPSPRQTNPQGGQNQTDSQVTPSPVVQSGAEHQPDAPEEPPGNQNALGPWYKNPDWWQVILSVAVGVIAWRAFHNEREAVRLTQRADLLVYSIGLDPAAAQEAVYRGMPMYMLETHAQVVACFKNFGPTRASNVQWDLTPIAEGVTARKSEKTDDKPPTIVVGPGGDFVPRTGPLNAYYDDSVVEQIGRGKVKFSVRLSVEYLDVFGKRHRTVQVARYFNGKFRIDQPIESD